MPAPLRPGQVWGIPAVRELTNERERPPRRKKTEGRGLAASSPTLEPVQAAAVTLLPLSLHSVQDGLCPAPNLLVLLLGPFGHAGPFSYNLLAPKDYLIPCPTFRFHFKVISSGRPPLVPPD